MKSLEIEFGSHSGGETQLLRTNEFRNEAHAREIMGKRGWLVSRVREVSQEELASQARAEDQRRLELAQDAVGHARSTGGWEALDPSQIDAVASGIILTTLPFVAGQEIESELGVVSAECVYGMNLFRDIFGAIRDVVGGRSKAHQKVFRDARNTVLSELRREALIIGADAVLGIRLNYSEIDGGTKNGMLMACISGTAVKLRTKS